MVWSHKTYWPEIKFPQLMQGLGGPVDFEGVGGHAPDDGPGGVVEDPHFGTFPGVANVQKVDAISDGSYGRRRNGRCYRFRDIAI